VSSLAARHTLRIVRRSIQGLLARWDRVMGERLRTPGGWLSVSRRKARTAAALITLEVAAVTTFMAIALRRFISPPISLVVGSLTVAFIWGLALRPLGTAKALPRVLLAILGLGFLAWLAFLVVLYVS